MLVALVAILVHGYHPFVEDAEIYVPGIKKLLNPALYPYNQGFFASHASLTLYPNLIGWSARLAHLPLEWALLGWHFTCIVVLVAGCWKLGYVCYHSRRAAWGSSLLVAGLLTIPVAGTALYIMDQYLNPRSFSTATATWIVSSALQRKYVQTAIWIGLTAFVHPLMSVFSLGFVLLLAAGERVQWSHTFAAFLLPVTLFPPVTSAYRQAIDAHSYFFILRWEWFEWLGLFGPLALFWWFAQLTRRRGLVILQRLCLTTIVFCGLCLLAAVVITIPPQLVRFAELQPMRGLHFAYILLFIFVGGLLAEYVLKAKLWRWFALFAPLCGGMYFAQRQLFPATHHLELPGRAAANPWLDTFLWIRGNTPVDAYFAVDPEHMLLPREDQHGFRAVAERSMLADAVKDSGAVTMFPALAQPWLAQVEAQKGWGTFGPDDFRRLHDQFGVTWFVLQSSGGAGLDCPYQNPALVVCRLRDASHRRSEQ